MSTRLPPAHVSLTCGHCQKPFSVPHWVPKQGKGKYCSLACANTAKRRIPAEATAKFNRRPAPDDLERTCPCGAVFRRSSVASEQRYCSAPCRAKPQNGATRSRPTPPGPKQGDWDLNGGSMVRCARCSRDRARGVACVCERWDCDGNPLTGVAS